MPLTVACPGCQSKLKVPDEAAGRKAKCPKCGGVILIPSAAAVPPPPPPPPPPVVEELEPVEDNLDFTSPPPPAKPSAKANRRDADEDGDDDRPKKATREPAKPKGGKRRDADDDYNPDDYGGDAGSRLHPGWKKVALGYHLLGFALLLFGLGLAATAGIFVALGGLQKTQAAFEVQNVPSWDKTAESRVTADNPAIREVMSAVLVTSLTGGGLLSIAVLLVLAGHLLFVFMPKDEEGGKGKTLGILLFVFLLIGLSALNAILLPLYTMGIGSKLEKPKVKKAGIGLLVWFLLAPILLAGASLGGFFGMMQLGGKVEEKALAQSYMFAGIVAGGLTVGAAVICLLGVGGCFTTARRGILAAVRERGILDGEDPQPKEEPKPKGKGKKGDDEDDDRPKKRKAKDADEGERPAKKKVVREEEENDAPPPKAKSKRPAAEEDEDAAPPKPKRRRDEDDDEDDDRPRKKR